MKMLKLKKNNIVLTALHRHPVYKYFCFWRRTNGFQHFYNGYRDCRIFGRRAQNGYR